mmetsp:Transcript_9611/g.13476  ORF Transcript_9611/g.13476 Transcript_9611/m.13476 type:complete len:207 (-) Transcript_9611:231-851(-)
MTRARAYANQCWPQDKWLLSPLCLHHPSCAHLCTHNILLVVGTWDHGYGFVLLRIKRFTEARQLLNATLLPSCHHGLVHFLKPAGDSLFAIALHLEVLLGSVIVINDGHELLIHRNCRFATRFIQLLCCASSIVLQLQLQAIIGCSFLFNLCLQLLNFAFHSLQGCFFRFREFLLGAGATEQTALCTSCASAPMPQGHTQGHSGGS